MIWRSTKMGLFILALVVFCSSSLVAETLAAGTSSPIPEFQAKLRILDLTLSKVSGTHQVTDMIAEIVNIAAPAEDAVSADSPTGQALAFLRANAKQISLKIDVPEAQQNKLRGFFHPFILGVHKSGVFKGDAQIKVVQPLGTSCYVVIVTDFILLDQ